MALKKPEADPKDSPVVPDVYDVRLRLRYLSQGLLNKKDLEKHLASLPDDAVNGEVMSFEQIVNSVESSSSSAGVNGRAQH